MFKRFMAILGIAVLTLIGVTSAGPANAAKTVCCGGLVGHYADEHLVSWNANDTAAGILDIEDYFISDTRSDGTRVLYFEGGDYDTVNNITGGRFNADYIRIAAEKTPGNYVTIKSYGSTTGPQNTVATSHHIPAQAAFVITDPSDTPAWRWTVCGFIGNDPYCDVDYGAI